MLAQYDVLVSAYRPQWEAHVRYFTPATLAVAGALPALLLALLRREAIAARGARLVRETPARRVGALVAAALLTAAWLLSAVDADGSIANTASGVAGHVLWSMDEPFAILDGRTPLVDFHAQYGQLVPVRRGGRDGAARRLARRLHRHDDGVERPVAARALRAAAAHRALLAARARALRAAAGDRLLHEDRAARRPLRAGEPVQPVADPLRRPYLVAWLLARHVDDAGPRRPWVLFLVAGLALVNNPEFGAGAVAALAVALVAVRPPRSRAAARRLAGEAAGGLAAACCCWCC